MLSISNPNVTCTSNSNSNSQRLACFLLCHFWCCQSFRDSCCSCNISSWECPKDPSNNDTTEGFLWCLRPVLYRSMDEAFSQNFEETDSRFPEWPPEHHYIIPSVLLTQKGSIPQAMKPKTLRRMMATLDVLYEFITLLMETHLFPQVYLTQRLQIGAPKLNSLKVKPVEFSPRTWDRLIGSIRHHWCNMIK